MDSKRTAFVISPIGQEGSAVRQHADDVFDFIIKPAMEECGVQAYRSDHMHESGRISEQMFGSILHADLCIAVLTGHNPNVFYELAVAQSFARPVIMLIEKGQILPFDIHDLRCVHYDLMPRPLFDRVYVGEIVAHVRNLEASGWKASSPIGVTADAGEPPAGVTYVERSGTYLEPDAWLQVLQEATTSFDIMGITLGSWRRTTGFRKALEARAAAGCRTRILLMHPDNPALPAMINQAIDEVVYDSVLHNIEVMAGFFARIAQETPGVELRRVQHGMMHGQLTRTDVRAFYIPYLYGARTSEGPLLEAQSGSRMFALMGTEFDALWSAQEPATPNPAPDAGKAS